jgi:Asp-tRNA(Asn)/Glu-tRNA(Gln) amidotransferase A subunit family amidase
VRNPYDLTRTPGGSSGGTAAAIAANFALLGVGSDTGQSIRSPASANSLVGVRPTRGLVSRAGVMPNSFTQDEVGPITRTVRDAALLLYVLAGFDPRDPVTALGVGRAPASHAAALDAQALHDERIGARLRVLHRDVAAARGQVEGVDVVLEDHRDAVQRTDLALAFAPWRVEARGLLQRPRVDGDQRLQRRPLAVVGRDAGEVLLRQLRDGQSAAAQRRMDAGDRCLFQDERGARGQVHRQIMGCAPLCNPADGGHGDAAYPAGAGR